MRLLTKSLHDAAQAAQGDLVSLPEYEVPKEVYWRTTHPHRHGQQFLISICNDMEKTGAPNEEAA